MLNNIGNKSIFQDLITMIIIIQIKIKRYIETYVTNDNWVNKQKQNDIIGDTNFIIGNKNQVYLSGDGTYLSLSNSDYQNWRIGSIKIYKWFGYWHWITQIYNYDSFNN